MSTSATEFREDWISPHADPQHDTAQDFDWDDLAIRLGEATEHLEEPEISKLAIALRVITSYVLNTDLRMPGSDRKIARRFIALAWVVNPAAFQGQSLSQIAKALKVYPERLYELSGEATRAFGVENRGQGRAWNRKPRTGAEPPRLCAESTANAHEQAAPGSEVNPLLSGFLRGLKQGGKQS